MPKHHRFEYAVRYCLVELDAPRLPACCSGMLANRLTAKEAREFSGCSGPVKLLLLPQSAGYEQNPICVYYCFSVGGETLERCIAEVTNTPWGDRVQFCFEPSGDVLPKAMHVSPLQDMRASWSLATDAPSESLFVRVNCCRHPEHGAFFYASLKAHRVPSPADSRMWALFMPHRVTLWIYWHAVLLLWRGLPFFNHLKYAEDPDAYKREVCERARDERWRMKCGAMSSRVGDMTCCPYMWRDSLHYPWN